MCVEYITISLSYNHNLNDLLQNYYPHLPKPCLVHKIWVDEDSNFTIDPYYYDCMTVELCARSLVVRDLRWETRGSRFESGCWRGELSAVITRPMSKCP